MRITVSLQRAITAAAMRLVLRAGQILCVVVAIWLCVSGSAHAASNAQGLTPNNSPPPLQQGINQYRQGNYQEAIAQFTQAIEQVTADKNYFEAEVKSHLTTAYSNRCLSHLALEDFEEAIVDCTIVLQNTPDQAEAYLNRGLAYYNLSQIDAAITDYNQLLQLHPNDYRGFYNRALAWFAAGNMINSLNDYNHAIHYATEMTVGDTDWVLMHKERGIVHFQLADYKAAIADFSRAIAFDTVNVSAYFYRACACQSLEWYDCAQQDFTTVLKLEPGHGQSYLNRGIAHYQSGDIQEAIVDLRCAIHCFKIYGDNTGYQQAITILDEVQNVEIVYG